MKVMMMSKKLCLLVLCALLPLIAHADLELTSDCQEKLVNIWSGYTNATTSVDITCNLACRTKCKTTLEAAIESAVVASCPSQADITRCFKVRFHIMLLFVSNIDNH